LHNSTDYVILRREKITIKIIPAMKKIFSFVVVLAAVAMVGCAGNSGKKAAAEVEAQATEAAACAECTEKCDSTVCAEECDSTKTAVAVEETAVEENK
jgi:hypothetical protein